MALILKHAFAQSDDKLMVSVYDITGIYNVTSKPGGYGTPNAAVADFNSCSIDVYFPDATTLLPQATIGATIDMYNTLPNSTGTPFVLDSVAVFGSSQAWADGEYRFVVTQTDGTTDPETTYISDTKVPIIASVKCCVDNLVLVADSCTCKGKSNVKLLLADAQLWNLYVKDRTIGMISNAESCNWWNKIAEILIDAISICNSVNCQSCQNAKCC